MPEISLPILSAVTTPTAAIEALRAAGRSAVVVEVAGDFFLLTAGDVVVENAKGARSLLALVKDDRRVPRAPRPRPLFGYAREYARERPETDDLAVLRPYTLTHTEKTSARLKVTDDLAARYVASPSDYYCDGPRHHDDFPPPDVAEGDDCPRGDGYKIVRTP